MEPFLFIANTAWLDFVNTEIMTSTGRRDLLKSFEDLVEWMRAGDLVSEADTASARERVRDPQEAERALAEARRFRATLRAAAESLAAGGSIDDDALETLNRLLVRGARRTLLERRGDAFARTDRWVFDEPLDVLAPIAESARDFLADGDRSLVRKCRNPECILFFYDTTKNHARAWCSMSACGNRTKVAAHYRRRRTSGAR